MQRRIGQISIETIAGESEKFVFPMVLVHGLWCTGAAWHRFMGYFAHRGWICHAIHLRGRDPATPPGSSPPVSAQELEADLRQVLAACPTPPVLLGHDTGAVLALACRDAASAVVGIAPRLPEALAGLDSPGAMHFANWWSVRRRGLLPPPRGSAAESYFGKQVPGGVVAETAAMARAFGALARKPPSTGAAPVLLLGGARDKISVPDRVEAMATRLGAEYASVDAGHALPWDKGWEKRVGEVHRWLVKTLGEPLLMLRDEEEEGA
jgi:pimeloyl-ACP methyl ester carboxylesterase